MTMTTAATPSKHIRPRKRTTFASDTTTTAKSNNLSSKDDNAVVVDEHLRQRIHSWTTTTTTTTAGSHASALQSQSQPPQQQQQQEQPLSSSSSPPSRPAITEQEEKNKKKSILKQKPKYSSSTGSSSVSSNTRHHHPTSSSSSSSPQVQQQQPQQNKIQEGLNKEDIDTNKEPIEGTETREPVPIVQERIVERKRNKKPSSSTLSCPITSSNTTTTTTAAASASVVKQQQSAASGLGLDSATAIEGYVPKTYLQQQQENKTKVVESNHAAGRENQTDEEEQCLVFDSLADLMEHAGIVLPQPPVEGHQQQLKSQNKEKADTKNHHCEEEEASLLVSQGGIIPPGSLVEANLSFQCMDPDTYEEQLQLLQQEQQENDCIPLEDNEEEEEEDVLNGVENEASLFNDDDDDDEDNDNAIIQSLRLEDRDENEYYSDDDEVDDKDKDLYDEDDKDDVRSVVSSSSSTTQNHLLTRPHYAQRPFLTLWKAISQWVTPQAVLYLRQSSPDYHDNRIDDNLPLEEQQQSQLYEEELENNNDNGETNNHHNSNNNNMVALQRCAGLYAMMQLHIRSALQALQYDTSNTRLAQVRLADLLRCFDYTQPMPKFLDTAHVKALTCILLHTVLVHQEGFVEELVLAAGDPPGPCLALGLSMGEYRNLTKAILNFGVPDDDHVRIESHQNGQQRKNGFH